MEKLWLQRAGVGSWKVRADGGRRIQDTAPECVFEQSHPNIHFTSVRNTTLPYSDLSSSLCGHITNGLIMNVLAAFF